MPRYDGLADQYAAFQDEHESYYAVAGAAVRRMLGAGRGRCLDIGCGGGRFLPLLADLGWQPVGLDESADQLRVAREGIQGVALIRASANKLPFLDASMDACVSLFTHTDFDDFARAVAEIVRVLKPSSRFVYVGNHPCFVGPTQEHRESGVPRLHPGYRRAGRVDAAAAPGVPGAGWRARLGSFVHLPLGEFLSAFAGLALIHVDELNDGSEYPKTIALAFTKP